MLYEANLREPLSHSSLEVYEVIISGENQEELEDIWAFNRKQGQWNMLENFIARSMQEFQDENPHLIEFTSRWEDAASDSLNEARIHFIFARSNNQ